MWRVSPALLSLRHRTGPHVPAVRGLWEESKTGGLGDSAMTDAVTARNDTIVRLALTRIGRALCPHSFALIQHRRRLFLRCPECGAETEGFAIGDGPKKRPGMERAELCTINHAAKRLGRSWEWTFAAVKDGRVPVGVWIGEKLWVHRTRLDEFLEAGGSPPNQERIEQHSPSAESECQIPKHRMWRV
jgi:hypothetical protein